jgi:peptidoglycan/LPS O-acetylase OafA/YrhL
VIFLKLDSNIKKPAKLDSLTSFRFIAAFLVFLHHVHIFSLYKIGYLGVSFFFILSGFILAYNYKLRIKDSNSIYNFYTARFSKIYPVHMLTFFMAIPYYFFIPLHHRPILYVFQGFTNLFLIQSYIPFGNFSFNGVSWSLSDEFFFYFLFPFILLFIIKKINKNSIRLFSIIMFWVILMLIFVSLPKNNDIAIWLTYVFPGTRIIEFIAGIILGLLFLEYKSLLSKSKSQLFTILEATLIILILSIVYISPLFNQYLRYGLVFLPFWGSIIFIFAFQKGVISKLLGKKLFVYLGNISFSFYMIHNLVLSYILFLWKPNIPVSVTIIVCFFISVLLSALMYKYYEEPVRKRVKRYINNLRSRKKLVKPALMNNTKYTLEK